MRAARGLLAGGLLLALACARAPEAWQRDLASPDPFVRGLAAIGLSVDAPGHVEVFLPELLAAIDRPDVGLERAAAAALVRVGGAGAGAFVDELRADPLMSADRRGALMNAIVAGGPDAVEPIVGCLRGAAGTLGGSLVGDLGDLLLHIGPPAAPALARMLDEEADLRLRRYAAFLLLRLGPAARAAQDVLERAARAEDPELRRVATEALGAVRTGGRGSR